MVHERQQTFLPFAVRGIVNEQPHLKKTNQLQEIV